MSFGSQTPRQKMINLMYIVLMAMLALNVSSDVWSGFTLVDDGLLLTTNHSSEKNLALYDAMAQSLAVNPEKVGHCFEKAFGIK